MKLKQRPPDDVISAFSPLLQPERNVALPGAYSRYRQFLYDSILWTLRRGAPQDRCDAFELWARLTPPPFDLADNVLALLEETQWITELTERQLIRIGLLIASVIESIPPDKTHDPVRLQLSQRLLRWCESTVVARQRIARYVLNEVCQWWFGDRELFVGGAFCPREMFQAKSHAIRLEDVGAQVELLLAAAENTWDDPWHADQRRGLTEESSDSDHWCVNAIFQATMAQTIANESEDPLACTKALWNLSCLAAAGSRFEEFAYRAFHGRQRLERAQSATVARRALRESLFRFQQDNGPIASMNGQLPERAATKVMQIRKSRLYLSLLKYVQKTLRTDDDSAEASLIDFFHDAILSEHLARGVLRLDIERPEALAYLKCIFRSWRVDGIRGDERRAATLKRLAATSVRAQSLSATTDELPPQLEDLSQDEAAAVFFYWMCETTREEASKLLCITPNSLNGILGAAKESIKRVFVIEQKRATLNGRFGGANSLRYPHKQIQ